MKKIISIITICLLSFPCFSQGNIRRSEKSANETKERQFIIDEFDYKVKVYLQGTPGEMYAVMEQDGMTYREFLDINNGISIDKAFDQYQGICYFYAAAYVGDRIVSSNGHYSKSIMKATLSLLKKGMEYFSVSRGNCLSAFSATKSRYDMLLEISKEIENSTGVYDDYLLNDISLIIWGMDENPVELCDLQSQM